MLLGIEPRTCKVCGKGLYRNVTFLRGGWSRCSVCDEFVHYSCLASGRVKFLKRRPRLCKSCLSEQSQLTPQVQARQTAPEPPAEETTKVAVGS